MKSTVAEYKKEKIHRQYLEIIIHSQLKRAQCFLFKIKKSYDLSQRWQ